MLEQKDLQAIGELFENAIASSEVRMVKRIEESETRMVKRIQEEIAESETRMVKRIQEEIAESEARMTKRLEERITKSEAMVLDELDRVQSHLEKRIDTLKADVEELQTNYRIEKIREENNALLTQRVDDLTERVERLESRTA